MTCTTAVHEVTIEHTEEPCLLTIRGAVADDDGTIRILDRHGYERHYEVLGYPSVDSDGRSHAKAHYVGGIDTTDPHAEFEHADGREPTDLWDDTVTIWKAAKINSTFLLDEHRASFAALFDQAIEYTGVYLWTPMSEIEGDYDLCRAVRRAMFIAERDLRFAIEENKR